MKQREIYNCAQMMELIQEIGFLPLLDSGIRGYSAEEMVADDCRYVVLPDGGWDRCGSGKGPSSRRATASMASSLLARLALSVVSGGQTSATIAVICTQHRQRVLSTRPSCLPCRNKVL